MPEIAEIYLTSQFLLSLLKNSTLDKIDILSGRYTHENIKNYNMLTKKLPLKLENILTHGKLMYFIFDNDIYLLNTFGLTGSWDVLPLQDNSRIKFVFSKNSKEIIVYYNDTRNFGTFIVTNQADFDKKIKLLAPDALQSNITFNEFNERFEKLVDNKKYKNNNIYETLMEQKNSKGLVSGLGNYLTPEILYHAKILPTKKLKDFDNTLIESLYESIMLKIKEAYVYNNAEYLETNSEMEKFSTNVKKLIKLKKLPNLIKSIKFKNLKKFKFNVYKQKKDELGNPVEKISIIKNRTCYFVPKIQK